MISDPKLPFASDTTGVGELKSPEETSVALGSVSVSRRLAFAVARVWLRRIGVLLFVFLCATLGVMLMIVPWRPEWSDNPLLLPYPALRDRGSQRLRAGRLDRPGRAQCVDRFLGGHTISGR